MFIAVASGKGGTGKTTVSVALAQALSARLLDADVEEPNAHLFLRPELFYEETVFRMVPEVDEEKCSFCKKCKEICRFNAITVFPGTVLVFPELCHACYGCLEVCPEECIKETKLPLGRLLAGKSGDIVLAYGELKVGEAMASPLIKALKKQFLAHDEINIIDCPPGTACPVLTAVKDAHFCILVAEPTPFGLHDLKQAYGAIKTMNISMGVVINRSRGVYEPLMEFLRENKLPLLLEIPDDKEIAKAYSRGIPLLEARPDLAQSFRDLYQRIEACL